MENDWSRERLGQVSSEIEDEGIELVPPATKDIKKAGELRKKYGALGVFDSFHLGAASARDLPIVSTDTMYPDIEEVKHIDPRDLKDGT